MKLKHTRAGRAGGFTLIEMVAVIFIIGILTTFLVVTLGKTGEAAKEKITASYLQQLSAAIAEYENQHGDFPPSAWKEEWNTAPNSTNVGAEALVLTLFSGKFQANLPDDRLVNTDNDMSQKPLARFPKADLFELKDEWGNPIAYLHRRDYKRQDVYLLLDPATGEPRESSLLAAMNPKTGEPFNPRGFQLVSAGVDGEFGTADDIGNWAKPEEE
ncbi:MAG: hypothetical protein RL277_1567 [Planctomycetota bacterium]|jgi:prepilin-type N-terminal cleavage/methylation domain-containing protein